MRCTMCPPSRNRCAEIFPRLRSEKNSGGLSEDILNDGLGQVVLFGNLLDGLGGAPQRDNVLDLHLVLGEHRGAPVETWVDKDLSGVRVLGQA
jgi:hypothetical protein